MGARADARSLSFAPHWQSRFMAGVRCMGFNRRGACGYGNADNSVVNDQQPIKQPSELVRNEASEREWLRGSLSKEARYRLIVSGELGPKEIGKLIKLLQAQQAVLSDDDSN